MVIALSVLMFVLACNKERQYAPTLSISGTTTGTAFDITLKHLISTCAIDTSDDKGILVSINGYFNYTMTVTSNKVKTWDITIGRSWLIIYNYRFKLTPIGQSNRYAIAIRRHLGCTLGS